MVWLVVSTLTVHGKWYALLVLIGSADLVVSAGLVVMQSVVNPNSEVFVPGTPGTDRHRGYLSGSSLIRREVLPYVSRQTRQQEGRGCQSWLRLEWLHPLSGSQGVRQVARKRRLQQRIQCRSTAEAKKKRRRGRAAPRLGRKIIRMAWPSQEEVIVRVATYHMHTLAAHGKRGYGQDECGLAKCRQLGRDVTGLQGTM